METDADVLACVNMLSEEFSFTEKSPPFIEIRVMHCGVNSVLAEEATRWAVESPIYGGRPFGPPPIPSTLANQ
jgi:hypothetical protein